MSQEDEGRAPGAKIGAQGRGGSVVSLSLFRFESVAARLWAFAQMGLSRPGFMRLPEARFVKMFGSGVGEGFTPWPNTAVYGVLAVWPDEETARRSLAEARPFRRYQAWASERWTVYLAPLSSRGAWDGRKPFTPGAAPRRADGPIAALTRASINPSKMLRFWRHEPEISRRVGVDPAVRFKIGLGEMPLFRQVTFSIWPDVRRMDAFARDEGPHAEAIRAVRANGYFSEELYARFAILGDEGSWEGRAPLAGLALAPEAPRGAEAEATLGRGTVDPAPAV